MIRFGLRVPASIRPRCIVSASRTCQPSASSAHAHEAADLRFVFDQQGDRGRFTHDAACEMLLSLRPCRAWRAACPAAA